jgi:predicted nucleic acid-binding protein
MIFIDSNMWCYYFDQRLPEHERVRDTMRELIKTEEIACNTIIVMEVAHYLVRNFPEKNARKKIDYFVNLRNIKIIDFNRQMLSQTLESLLSYSYSDGLGGRDATILATLNSEKIQKVVSHDSIFRRLASKLELEIIDPAQ